MEGCWGPAPKSLDKKGEKYRFKDSKKNSKIPLVVKRGEETGAL